MGLMLGGIDTQPVTVGLLSFMGTSEYPWGSMAAATVVAIVPEILCTGSPEIYDPRFDFWCGEINDK